MPPAELDPASSISNETQATQLMESQGQAIREHFGEIGPAAVHEAATVEHARRRAAAQERGAEAELKHQREKADAQHSDGRGTTE